MFLGKGAPKICSKFTGEHPCQSVISMRLLCNKFFGVSIIKLYKSFILRDDFMFILKIVLEFIS